MKLTAQFRKVKNNDLQEGRVVLVQSVNGTIDLGMNLNYKAGTVKPCGSNWLVDGLEYHADEITLLSEECEALEVLLLGNEQTVRRNVIKLISEAGYNSSLATDVHNYFYSRWFNLMAFNVENEKKANYDLAGLLMEAYLAAQKWANV